MFSRFALLLLVTLGGAGLTLQMVWNARLRTATGSPVLTTIISVAVTLLSLAVVWVSGATNRGTLRRSTPCRDGPGSAASSPATTSSRR